MPDKPTWSGNLDRVAQQLRELSDPWVDRSCIQNLLGVGPRRAQQILAPCVIRRVGVNGMADREAVIAHLRHLASGESVRCEQQRRQRLAEHLDALDRERRQSVLVAAPVAVMHQRFADLPEGIVVTPGLINIRFRTPTEALQKLLSLAMAIRNDGMQFELKAGGG